MSTDWTRLPLLLTGLRAVLGPLVLVLAAYMPQPALFVLCLTLAFFSDVFDGITARRLGVATPALRRLDSVADSIFYFCATYAVWILHPAAIRDHLGWFAALFALEALRYLLDFLKFRREAAYHMYSSKLWGVALFAGFCGVLGVGETGWPVLLAIIPGLIADCEGLAISFILPQWRNDVPSVFHALALRRAMQLHSPPGA